MSQPPSTPLGAVPQCGAQEPRGDFAWVSKIVDETFRRGLAWAFDSERVAASVRRWYRDADPVYLPLLTQVHAARRTRFICDWLVAQTLATNCRFFMEEAIRNLILHQKTEFGRKVQAIYTRRDLVEGHLARYPDIAFMGEERKEWSSGKSWTVRLRSSAVERIDELRSREDRELLDEDLESLVRSQLGDKVKVSADELGEALREVVLESLSGEGASESVRLMCNLLVIAPPPGGDLHAFRFVNTKNADLRVVQGERRDYLRLLAYIHQEKPLRNPEKIHLIVTPLVDRFSEFSTRSYEKYFRHGELWTSKRFWQYVGVPFEAVREGLLRAGQIIPESLEALAPHIEKEIQASLFDSD